MGTHMNLSAAAPWLIQRIPGSYDWELVACHPWRRYRGRITVLDQPARVCVAMDQFTGRFVSMVVSEHMLDAAKFDLEGLAFRKLEQQLEHDAPPPCDIPDCPERGIHRFTAPSTEGLRICGRTVGPGESVRICTGHAEEAVDSGRTTYRRA